MTEQCFGGVESFRFIPRGIEVNGKEFVPANELENCQEVREKIMNAYTETAAERDRLVAVNEKLIEVLKNIDHAIDQEYDVDDGIANFTTDMVLAWQQVRAVLSEIRKP